VTYEMGEVAIEAHLEKSAESTQHFLASVDSPGPRLTLLGGFSLKVGTDVVPLARFAQRLIALLALRGAALDRSYVAGVLWGDSTEERAHGSLRSTLWKLRAAGLMVVRICGDSLELSSDVDIDVRQVTALARAVVTGRFGEEEAMVTLLEPRFSGELLPGWHDEWVLGERERHRQLSLHALEALCEHLTVTRRYGAAVLAALAAIDQEPLRESAHRALIKVYLAEGNASEAIRRYQQYEQIAARDLGVEPSAMMRSLRGEIATV
jgi:DNA-binding SARP family transcriptional activator